jgi:hypothetical protein
MSERRLGPETKAIIEAIHGTENMENNIQVGLWTMERIGKTNIYKVYITVDPHAIAMPAVAADVITQLHIPFPHRWLRTHFYHTDAAYVVSLQYLRITLRRELNTMFPVQFADDLFCEFDINAVMIIEKFGEGFEYEAGTYNLILNTNATDLIFPLFYIQKLET